MLSIIKHLNYMLHESKVNNDMEALKVPNKTGLSLFDINITYEMVIK